jgi:hypothetical protein
LFLITSLHFCDGLLRALFRLCLKRSTDFGSSLKGVGKSEFGGGLAMALGDRV